MVLRFKSSTKGNQKNDPSNPSNITIEAYHKDKVAYFKALQNSIPEKRKKLKQIIKDYKELKKVANEDKFNLELMIKKNNMRDEIEDLQKAIVAIENKEEEHEYFMKADSVLNVYFDNMENSKLDDGDHFFSESSDRPGGSASDPFDGTSAMNTLARFIIKQPSKAIIADESTKRAEGAEEEAEAEAQAEEEIEAQADDAEAQEEGEGEGEGEVEEEGEEEEVEVEKKNPLDIYAKKRSIVSFGFGPLGPSGPSNPSGNMISPSQKPIVYSTKKITDFLEKECKINKKELLDEYLRSVDKNYAPKMKIDTSFYKCPCCDIEMILYSSDGVQICQKCGLEQNVIIESEKPSFKDPPIEAVFFSYKPINHFNEILAQFQAKESTEIPEDVYNTILQEIKKERISNLASLTTDKIKKYLKKNGLTKYTDHISYILYKINGIPPPQLSKDLEEKLRLMFKEIQGPFMEVCPNDRKNLLNYSYVLHKFFELLELDDFKKYFPLLKDREKLYKTEMVWKKICEKLGWKFIKSI